MVYASAFKTALMVFAIVGCLAGCHSGNDETETQQNDAQNKEQTRKANKNRDKVFRKADQKGLYQTPVRNKALKGEQYTLSSSKDTTVSYKTGTKLHIPENAFLDQNGNVVKGQVELKYREMHTPFDFYASGVPMEYQANGKDKVFKSAGMCRVEASKNEQKLRANPEARIEVEMQSFVKGDDYQVYKLNENKGDWKKTGDEAMKKQSYEGAKNRLPTKPEPPQKDGPKSFQVENPENFPEHFKALGKAFTVKVDQDQEDPVMASPSSYPDGRDALYSFLAEMVEYPKSEGINPASGFLELNFFVNKDGNLEYSGIREEMPNAFGDSCQAEVYEAFKKMQNWEPAVSEKGSPLRTLITIGFSFRNGEVAAFMDTIKNAYEENYKKVEFKPVNPAQCERYQNPRSTSIEKGACPGTFRLMTYDNMFREGEPKECLCVMAFKDDNAYGKAMKAFKDRYQEMMKKREQAEQAMQKSWQNYRSQLQEMDFPGLNASKDQRIQRVFELSEFGFTNIDKPTAYPEGAHLMARFRDENGNPIHFKRSVKLAVKNENALYRYDNEIRFDPDKANLLWGITGKGKLAYLKPEDFDKIDKTSGTHTFNMKIHEGKLKSKAVIKEVLL